MTHNNEAPDQSPLPDAQVGHRSSTIKVYDLAQIIDSDPGQQLRVYTEGRLPGEMQQASLVTQTTQTEEGGTALKMTFRLQMDNMVPSSDALAKLQNHMLVSEQDHYYKTNRAYYSNALSIRTERGLRLLARFDSESRQLVISNSMRLLVEGKEEVSISPTALDYGSMSAGVQLLEMGRVMVDVLTYEPSELPSDPSAYRGWPEVSRECSIIIGKDIHVLPSPSQRAALGKSAAAGASRAEPVARPEITTIEESDFEVRLSDIGGHEEIKKTLRDIVLMFKRPEIAAKWKIPLPRGVLLYGEPGTGKTMLAKALANELGAAVRRIQGDEIFGMYVGESEQNMQGLFDELNEAQVLTMALWDEFDASMGMSDRIHSGADQTRNAVVGIFNQQMEVLNPKVLVVAITNRLDGIPSAVRRAGRFDYQLHVPMPDQEARLAIMSNIALKYVTVEVSDDNTPGSGLEPVTFGSSLFDSTIDWSVIAQKTDRMSGAQINEVFRRLAQDKALEEMRTDHVTLATQADLIRTIAAMQRDSPS